jgi:hypothetical protein
MRPHFDDEEPPEHDIPPSVPAKPPIDISDETQEVDLLDMDQVMALTQRRRLKVVNLVSKSQALNEDPAMVSALLKGLGDMDKAVVQRRRVGIEEEVAKSSEEQAQASAAILDRISRQAFMRIDPTDPDAPKRSAPKIEEAIPAEEMVAGETEVGTHSLTFDGFIKEQKENAPVVVRKK